MKKMILIMLFMSLIINSIFCQNFEFIWQIEPSFIEKYSVTITRGDSNSKIRIQVADSKDVIISQLDKTETDSLYCYLEKISFRNKGRAIQQPPKRKYYDSQTSLDGKWIYINGDTLKKEDLNNKRYVFDSDSNKYYKVLYMSISFNEGTMYTGLFTTQEEIKEFKIHSVRINEEEYRLNLMMLDLILKYYKTGDLSELKELIESEKPGKYSNI